MAAGYILNEIKMNVRGQTAETIHYLIDEDTLKQRRAEWDKLPFYAKLVPPPQPDLLDAMAVWYLTVKTDSTWEQNMTPGAMGDDTTSMKIGFELYHCFGKYAEKLTSQHILDVLVNTSAKGFS